MKLQPSLLLILVLFLLMGSATAQARAVMQTAATSSNSLLADDFQPNVHGFQFKNYGRSHPEGDLTIAELRALFGDGVCAQIKGDTCIPTPQAELWIAKKNKTMEAGHCIGFTVMSYRLLNGEFTASQFVQTANTSSFDILQDVPIMRHIAQSYAMYYIPGLYKENAVTGTPVDVAKAMLAQKSAVDLGIFANDGAGHSMLGYGIQQNASGQYEILVYDNNHPGETKIVLVDPAANTWSYQDGAVSPGDTTKRTWAGDAKSATLEFIPLSAYGESKRSCPAKLCPNASASEGNAASRGALTLAYQGEADLVVTNDHGQRVGRAFGQFINTIPEASLLRTRGTRLGDYPPEIDVPADQDITVRLLADHAQIGDLQLYAPDFTLSVDGLHLTHNRNEDLTYTATTQQTHYLANNEQQPTFKLATTNYLAIVGNLKMQSASELALTVDPATQNLALASQGLSGQSASLIVVQLAGEQINLFASNLLPLPTGSTLTLDIAGWEGSDALPANVLDTTTGQSQPLTLENQSLATLIQNGHSGQEIIALLGELSAYLNQTQLEEMLAKLATLDLDAYDLGTVLFHLQPNDDHLLGFVEQATLLDDAQGLATLLFAQNKTDAQVAQLIAQLNLPNDLQGAVSDELATLAQVKKAIDAWDSYNPDDKLAALPQFLNDQSLAVEQVAIFLKSLTDLPLRNKAELVAKLALTLDEQAQLQTALGWAPAVNEDCAPPATTTTGAASTATSAITNSATPTATVTAPLTETLSTDVGIVNRDANLRSGPGTNYPTAGFAKKGERLTVVGINPAGDWYQLKTGGWIARFLLDGVKGPIATVDTPPASLPTPTTTVTASAPITPVVQATSTTTTTSGGQSSTIAFQANPAKIKQCGCTQISWQVEGVKAVYYQGQGQAGSGSKQECPHSTTNFTLKVLKIDGSEESRQVTVEVEPDATCQLPTKTPLPAQPPTATPQTAVFELTGTPTGTPTAPVFALTSTPTETSAEPVFELTSTPTATPTAPVFDLTSTPTDISETPVVEPTSTATDIPEAPPTATPDPTTTSAS